MYKCDKGCFLKEEKKNYLRQTDLFFLLQRKVPAQQKKKGKKKSEFSLEKCLSLVMNRCELEFRQQYRRENNTTARRKPQNTARQNDRLRRNSDAKQFEKYMKIKKLGCYCFSQWLVPPATPLPVLPTILAPHKPSCRQTIPLFGMRPVWTLCAYFWLYSRPEVTFVMEEEVEEEVEEAKEEEE